MNLTEEILKRVDALAQKLGTTAEYLWGVLVKQARVEAWTWIGWAGFWGVIALIASIRVYTAWKKAMAHDSKEDYYIGWIIVGTIATAISLLCFAVCFSESITPMFNPEYWALKQIIG